ncbi:MAG TPA: UDP-N-acetylmuramate dehydrogenase [Planctomycetes bacterium]|nr:UDP-N-acetylmuramate dehydrogenase [Planctomycetota bacterium]HIJ72027.1 UDP-N-acetylmuramate dehydrogenase [Planctomycetota bacterium]
MSIFKGLEPIIKQNCPLADYTWFGLGGNAEYLITPTTVNELQRVVKRCNENDLPMRVLGFGTNLLVSDEGVRGAVIKLQEQDFGKSRFNDDYLTVGAGAGLNKVVLDCVRKGLSGLEALTGIPGSVGGAIRMNAGGNFGDIGTSVHSVTLMDADGKIFEKSKPELVFDYRWTNITAKFVLDAKITLAESDKEQMLRTLKEVWIYKKNSQPLNIRSAGCVFKNPRGLSAGALIDRAGLKGLQIGAAQVSEKHANFIIAHKGCKSGDVQRLIEAVRERVKDKFSVELELELDIW